MPQIVETDIGNLEFPDDYTRDQMADILRSTLPGLRERVQKGRLADLAARVPRDAVIQGADTLMAGARAFQSIRDAVSVNGLRLGGAVAAMSSPVGEEHAAITAATDAAKTKADELDATYEQRLAENPVFSFGAELRKNAIAQDQTNPTLEHSIPAALSKVAPKLAEAAALETVAGPAAAVVAPAMMATKVGRMVPAMLSAGTAFGIGDEGKFNPTEAAIAAGTVPAFGAGESLASKIVENLPIKNVRLNIPDILKTSGAIHSAEEAMALGRRIEGSPAGFSAQVEQKLAGIPIGETGRKLIEQTGGVLAANGYLAAVQLPEILALPEDKRGAAIGDFLATNAAMSLLGYLPLLGGEPSKAKPEIIRRVGEKLKDELTTKYGAEPPPVPAAGLPEPPPQPRGPAPAPSEFAAPAQPTPEQLAAEEAAAQADIARREKPEPAPVAPQPAPKRRPIAPAEERPRFRPPMPTPVTPVPQTVTPVTPQVENAQIGYTPPISTGPPEATTPVVPEAQQKGEENALPIRSTEKIPLEVPPGRSEEMGGGIRQPAKPAVPQTEGQTAQAQGKIRINLEFPPTEAATKQLSELSNDSAFGDFMAKHGISQITIAPPYNFDLSTQAMVNPKTGEILLNPAVENPKQTLLHEVSHLRWNDESNAYRTAFEKLLRSDKNAQRLAKGYWKNGDIEESHSEVYAAFGSNPDSVSPSLRAQFSSPFTAAERAQSSTQPKLAQAEESKTIFNPKERTGARQYLTSRDDIAGSVAKYGDFDVSIKGVNGGWSKMKASEAAKLLDDPLFSGYVREVLVSDTKSPERFQANYPREVLQRAADVLGRPLVTEGGPILQPKRIGVAPGKLSVRLSEAPATGVTAQDIQNAFPAEQGFSVKPVALSWVGEQPSVGYLVQLPNGEIIVIDPTHDRIAFNVEKAAADWGFDPKDLAEHGVATGKWTAGGVQIGDLSTAGIIDLLKTSDASTLSHEKFEALWDLALSPEDRQSILNRYKTREKAAEAFRRSEGFTRSFWDKIKRFLEWLANLFRGDAFKKMRQKLGTEPSTPETPGEQRLSLETEMRNPREFQERLAKPITSPEEAVSLTRQAGAGAGLVPDEIAGEISRLNPADPVEKRMAGVLDFVLKLHGVAPALELQGILANPNIPEETKQAAISNVLRQIENVRVQASQIEDKLQTATEKLANALEQGEKITAKRLIEGKARQVADNLITGYRAYLTAQAANLPANQNIAAARLDAIRRMAGALSIVNERTPDALPRAIEAIADHIDELPVKEGPQAVIDAIRQKGILRGKAADSTIDLLTTETGGVPPVLLNPAAHQMLTDLAALKKKSDTYAKQIEVVEQAFRGKGKLTPVQLRKFADTYLRFRNKEREAAKAASEMDKQIKEADEDVQVFGRSHDLLARLQNSPQFESAFESAITGPVRYGYDLFKDIADADKKTGLTTFVSPLKQENEKGEITQNKFHVSLAPDREADAYTVSQMDQLLNEVDEFLAQPNIDPIEKRSWELRRDYIEQFVRPAAYGMKQMGNQLETNYGTLHLDPFAVSKFIFGGSAAAPRSELERLSYRAARDLNDDFLTTDLARNALVRTGHNVVFGDEATKIKVLGALNSHNWGVDKTGDWNVNILNPILASGQAAGQMRLKVGDYVPGTGRKITKEDVEVAATEKRYSQAIVNTVQGIGKKLAPALVNNPILIEDTFQGRKVRRSAFSPGVYTMARRFSASGLGITKQWFKDGMTDASRSALIREGVNFERAALSYVTTTNPEFNRQSPLNSVYEDYTADAARLPDKQVTNWDQLVDKLAESAISKGMFASKAEAIPAISNQLFSEIGGYMQAYQNATKAEVPGQTSETNPKTLMDFASAANSFTRRRGAMVAPDAFYDYTLTEGNDRIGFTAAGYQQFQIRNIAGLDQVIATLKDIESKLAKEINDLHENTGISKREARQKVAARINQNLESNKLSLGRLEQVIQTLEKVRKGLGELVVDRRDKNDAFMLYAMSRLQGTLSSGLLANPTAIFNNLAGGILTSNYLLQQNLGRARFLLSQIGSTKHTVKTLVNRVIRLTHADTPLGAFARASANLPIIGEMAKAIDEQFRDWLKLHAEMEAWGLREIPDKKNRLAAMAALKATAGAIETGDPSAISTALNYAETLPIVRQLLVHLRDLSPGAVDRFINESMAESVRRDIYEPLKAQALRAFKAREARGASNDFSQQSNLLTPAELGLSKSTGYRDLENYRDMFHSLGSFDQLLKDYYDRWKSAPDNEKSKVPLFPTPEAEGQITFNLAAHGNVATSGFTPPSMQGVGQRGLIKRLVFMFTNYMKRQSEQTEKLSDYDLRDPKVARKVKYFWQMASLLIVAVIAGAAAIELGSPITRAITGRGPAKLTAANVLSDPQTATVARYIGMTLANNIPYYGGVISRLVGNPGYGSMWDTADLIPVLGLIKDAAKAANAIGQTHNATFPAVDFLSRWFPPIAPALRLLPGVEGDIEAKNAARALRVVGPSEGIELAAGGGSQTTQTPASAAIRRLMAAAYRGDEAGVQKAFQEAVEEKRQQGSPDPEKAVLQSIASKEPARAVFGRAITPEEEARLVARMSSSQRADYQGAQNAFNLINSTLGTKYSLTSTPRARTPGLPGQPSRRSLTGTTVPSFARNRLRIIGARRRPFGHLSIRGASQRKSKRRSPARFSFSA